MNDLFGWGHVRLNVIRWVAGLFVLLANVSCIGRSCDASLRFNPMTVHESDITLSRPATTVDARFCMGTTCRSTPLDVVGQSCIRLNDFGVSDGFCLTPLTTHTLRVGGSLMVDEGQSPPSFVQLTITDHESGETLFDKKSGVSVHHFDDSGCHTSWDADTTL